MGSKTPSAHFALRLPAGSSASTRSVHRPASVVVEKGVGLADLCIKRPVFATMINLLLVVLARSVEDFERISRRLFSADPKIRRYTTSVVMDRVKVGLTVPVGA